MTSSAPSQCECGNTNSFDRKKSFLGFTRLICPSCKKQYDDPSTPLGKGYQITYWIFGVGIGLSLLNKIPIFITAAQKGVDVFFTVLMEQWLLLLFFLGSILALKKDAQIRKSINTNPKKNRLAIGIVITVLLLGMIGLYLTPKNVNQLSEQEVTKLLVDETQKFTQHLPMMVDNITRIDSIVAAPGRICIYSYTLLGINKNTFDSNRFINDIKPAQINAYKTREGLEIFRELNVEMRHIFSDEQGTELARISITPEDF